MSTQIALLNFKKLHCSPCLLRKSQTAIITMEEITNVPSQSCSLGLTSVTCLVCLLLDFFSLHIENICTCLYIKNKNRILLLMLYCSFLFSHNILPCPSMQILSICGYSILPCIMRSWV